MKVAENTPRKAREGIAFVLSLARVAATCALLPIAATSAFAQSDGPIAPAAPVASKPDDKGPDLTALRYYARSRDLNRVAAEIRRLKSEYPRWNPPDDLYAEPGPRVDEQPLWDLYAKSDYAGVEARIAKLQQQNPNWTPSKDFLEKFVHAKSAHAIVDKSNAKQYNEVVALAVGQDSLIACSDFDLAWRIAEAYAQVGTPDRALSVYRTLLTTCNGDPERKATAQKAMVLITDPAGVEAIMALGRKKPDGSNEFDDVYLGKLRADIGAAAAAAKPQQFDAARLEALEKAALAAKRDADEILLGFYYRKISKPDKALAMFRAAYDASATDKAAEGLVLSLREAGKPDEAEALSYEWRDKAPIFREMYIAIVSSSLTAIDPDKSRKRLSDAVTASAPQAAPVGASPFDLPGRGEPEVTRVFTPAEIERLGRFKVEVEIAKSALGASSMGWALYDAGGVEESAYWFQRSLYWGQNEDAALGLALAAKRLNDTDAYKQIVARFGPIYPRVAEIDREAKFRFGVLLPSDVSPEQALAHSRTLKAKPQKPRRKLPTAFPTIANLPVVAPLRALFGGG